VKICGITNLEDALAAAQAGADFLGFIFYPRSPRYLEPEKVREIVSQVRAQRLGPIPKFVGVFVNQAPETVARLLEFCGLDYAQLHGDEEPADGVVLGRERVIKAVRVRSAADVSALGRWPAALYLLDTYSQQPGGTGQTFDWKLAEFASSYGAIILAGGLTPENVAEAIRQVRPFGVDVSTGVESTPGRKDHDRLKQFIRAVRISTPPTVQLPDRSGYFGPYGGRFVPETLMSALDELERAYEQACADPTFEQELKELLRNYVGRPTPLYFARRLTDYCSGAKIYLKREDLAHTGAHKINNTIGQGLLARRMGKRRLIAETGAGQHGVATATVAAFLGLECVIYMGTADMARQAPNVKRMRLLGADVRGVDAGSRTLKEAINEAIRDWVTHVETTHYLLGSALGPHPYPMIVRDFQSVIGREARQQILEAEGRLPDLLIACVGGGSNAIGLFHAFRHDDVRLVGVEAGGLGIETGKHAARFSDPVRGRVGVLHGTRSYILQTADGQVLSTHSISAGLDYPGVGPEHSYLYATGRAEYTYATDEEALAAFRLLARLEGIIPALESAHALDETLKRAPKMAPEEIIIVNLSGRGDKELDCLP